MHESAAQAASPSASHAVWYSYAIIRVVPRVERGECLNVGVVLFARERGFLQARVELNPDRLRALAPDANLKLIDQHLRAFSAICQGQSEGGWIATLPLSERFHWLTAPRSTVIQTSAVHVGVTEDPESALEDLLDTFVRPPKV